MASKKKETGKATSAAAKRRVQNAAVKPARVALKAAAEVKPTVKASKPSPKPSAKATSKASPKRAVPRFMPKVDFVTFFSSFSEQELKTLERIYDFLPAALQDALDAEAVRRSAGERLIPAAEVLRKLM